jgi:hypothetical protein
MADVQARLDAVEGHIRSNAVLAIEHVVTASRDWFIHARPAQLQEWTERSMAWLRETYGHENVVAAVLHHDEITPHIQAVVVPIDERGHLNARDFIGGGRHRLGELQSSYARAVASLGLERGIQGSAAEHQRVKEFYARLREPERTAQHVARDLQVEAPTRFTLHPTAWAEQQTEQVQAHVVHAVTTMATKTQDALFRAERAEGHVQVLKDRLGAIERSYEALHGENRALAELTHQVDLAVVLRDLGAREDRTMAWQGRGAISMVMHTQGYTRDEAVGYLREAYGERTAAIALAQHTADERVRVVDQAPVPPLRLPEPAEERWSKVRAALVGEYRLPGNDIVALHAQGRLYADHAGHAVFLHHSAQGEVTGATLHSLGSGTPWQAMAPGTRSSEGHFSLSYLPADAREPLRLVLVATPLEALSYRAAHPREPVEIIAAASAGALPHQKIVQALARGGDVRAAFPRDALGERLWTELVTEHVYREVVQDRDALRRDAPLHATDWTGELRSGQHERTQQRDHDRGRGR